MSDTPSTPPAPHWSPLRRIARARPLTVFFLATYLVSALIWAPFVLAGRSPANPTTFAPAWWIMPGIAIGVSGVAFAMTALIDGKPGVKRLASRVVSWRHAPQWYLVAVTLLPVSGILVAAALGATDAFTALSLSALATYPAAYAAHFVFGPLFEESGWRGFALPRMQEVHGPLRGTLYLALLWTGWHFFVYIPWWFSDGVGQGVISAVVFTVTVVAMTFVFTWLSNNTQGSILLAMLLHGSVDGTATYIQRITDAGLISTDAESLSIGLGATVGYLLVALVLLIATRGRLSYRRYRREMGLAEVW